MGLLFVRATEPDLDKVEKILVTLNSLAPQIHIKARFLEVPKGTLDGFGKIIGGTNQPDQFTGILTPENAGVTLKALRARPGFKELAEPEVTATSGRQTQMRATQIMTIITNFAFTEGLNSQSNSITPQSANVETGPILDTVATVLSDGYTIDLRTTASLTEFLGYDKPPANSVEHINDLGEHVPVVLPSFDVRKASAHINLFDGQTVVLGGMKPRFYEAGREAKAEPDYFVKTKAAKGQANKQDKELLVFITVTLVDPAGNRLHSNGELPIARNSIPPQDSP